MKNENVDLTDIPLPIAVLGVSIATFSGIGLLLGVEELVETILGIICYLIPTIGYLILFFVRKLGKERWIAVAFLTPFFVILQYMAIKWWL